MLPANFSDPVPAVLAALHVAATVVVYLEHLKENPMSEGLEQQGHGAIATAPADHVAIASATVPAIVQAATSTPGVPQHHAMAVLGNVFAALAQQAPAILQVSRASPKTSGEVGIGFGLFAAIFQALAAPPQQ